MWYSVCVHGMYVVCAQYVVRCPAHHAHPNAHRSIEEHSGMCVGGACAQKAGQV